MAETTVHVRTSTLMIIWTHSNPEMHSTTSTHIRCTLCLFIVKHLCNCIRVFKQYLQHLVPRMFAAACCMLSCRPLTFYISSRSMTGCLAG